MTSNTHQLIQLLNDGKMHTGTALGKKLGVTRSAIWKLMLKLTGLGLPIQTISGKGYCLTEPIELLNLDAIKSYLPDTIRSAFSKIEIFESLESTNTYLASKLHERSPRLCLAEMQTAGKGRNHRHWHSPFGTNIYLSLLWQFEQDAGAVTGLSLVVALAIINALKEYGVTESIQTKWPNDIMCGDKKLAGVLIELFAETHGVCHAVIGVGLNVNMHQADDHISQPWTSVAEILGNTANRNQLTALLIEHLHNTITHFETTGLAGFIQTWQSHDHLLNQPVTLTLGKQTLTGIARGIDNQGYLQLETPTGIKTFSAGDVRGPGVKS